MMKPNLEKIINFVKDDPFCHRRITLSIINGQEPKWMEKSPYPALIWPNSYDFQNAHFHIVVRKEFHQKHFSREEDMVCSIIHEIGHAATTIYGKRFRDERQAWLCGLKHVPRVLIPNRYAYNAYGSLWGYNYPHDTSLELYWKIRRMMRK